MRLSWIGGGGGAMIWRADIGGRGGAATLGSGYRCLLQQQKMRAVMRIIPKGIPRPSPKPRARLLLISEHFPLKG